MTRRTALALIVRQDLNNTLATAGRLTETDVRAHTALTYRARREDIEAQWAALERGGR